MYKDMEWFRNVLRYGIGYFRYCATVLGTFFQIFGPPAPARDNYSAACLPAVHLRSLTPRLPSADAPL